MSVASYRWLLLTAAVAVPAAPAAAFMPYTPVPVVGPPVVGPGVMAPDYVYGKEYSHDLDFSVLGPAPDPQQVINWDGGGGTADGVDYSFTRVDWEADQQVDAIANSRDALYNELRRDAGHLVFSHDDLIAGYSGPLGGLTSFSVPSTGPLVISNGNTIGGAGEVSIEEAGVFAGPSVQGLWAAAPEVNAMPLPKDVDGLELWGHEPREIQEPEVPLPGDADKYSLDIDFPGGVSVWNAAGTPYLSHPSIVTAVEALLGPITPSAFSLRDEQQGRAAINLDALMVSDIIEDPNVFHEDFGGPTGEELKDQNGEPFPPFDDSGEPRGDQVIFSIRQIVDPADPDGYYATGSELFVLDSLAGPSFLKHGGHVWDQGYALAELALLGGPDGQFEDFHGVIDINAIEVIGEDQRDPCITGDYNCNGEVDAADYTVWRDSMGKIGPGLPADGDNDGDVDADDYAVWSANYGTVAPSLATAVPEPAAAGLAALALAGAALRRRD